MADQSNTNPAAVKTWLAGFLYRGRAPWETEPSAYHVEVGQYVEIAGMNPVQLPTLVLTPDAAQAAGHALPDVLSAISADALAELTALRASAADLATHNAALTDALSKAQTQAGQDADTINGLKSALAEAHARSAELAPAAVGL